MGGVYLDLESEWDRAKLAQVEFYFEDHRHELVARVGVAGRDPPGSWAVPTAPMRKLIVYPGDEPLHVTADIDALPLPHLARTM
jgi:hypothetical protein